MGDRLTDVAKTIAATTAVATPIAGFFIWFASLALARRAGWPPSSQIGSALHTAGLMLVETVVDIANSIADHLVLLTIVVLVVALLTRLYRFVRKRWPSRVPLFEVRRSASRRLVIGAAIALLGAGLMPAMLIEEQMTKSVLVQIDASGRTPLYAISRYIQVQQICRSLSGGEEVSEALEGAGVRCKGGAGGQRVRVANASIRDIYVIYVLGVLLVGSWVVKEILQARRAERSPLAWPRDIILPLVLFIGLTLGTPWMYGGVRSEIKLPFGASLQTGLCDGARVPVGAGTHHVFDDMTGEVSGPFPDSTFRLQDNKRDVLGSRIGWLLHIYPTDISTRYNCSQPGG